MFKNSNPSIQKMKASIKYGNLLIKFDLQFADRKTLGIQVHPNSKVYVTAPVNSDLTKIKAKVKSKANWILKQQEFFLSFHPLTPPREYLNGETHLYLGKQYRLKIIKSKKEAVKLKRGYIEVYTTDKKDRIKIKYQLHIWYANKASFHFTNLFNQLLPITKTFYQQNVDLKHKWLKKRWGSCSANGTITLNTELIKAPKKCIEYVIIHEFCHLAYLNHSKSFYNLLDEKLPNWRATKHYLEHFMV